MSDGQFSSKPIRSGPRTDITSGPPIGDALSDRQAEEFMQSKSVQRAIQTLLDEPFPDIVHVRCAPLPRSVPRNARELGEPIASATLVQEFLIGLLFLRFWGWVFMFFGVIIIVSGVVLAITTLFGEADARAGGAGAAIMVVAVGLGIAGAGIWFGILRGRVVFEMCWFCPDGMIWMTGSVFDWYPWDDVSEVYARLHADRPAVGVSFGRNVSWISFSDTQPSRMVVSYVENRASAAWLPTILKLLAEGKTVRFGSWRLHRSCIETATERLAWSQIADLDADATELVLIARGGAEMVVPLDEVPFPSLFTAMVRGLIGHVREGRA